MIELSEIKKFYELNGKQVPILKGISLFIGSGEFVSIMGPSGSGKSTLSAILGCLATATSGIYKLNGQDISVLKSDELAKIRNQSIGFIFQDFNLLSGLSALENVALPLVYAGVPTKKRNDRALECLAAVGLEKKAYNKPSQLSGGQKQRVAIARALVNEPSFLFADEPTGALDKKTGHEILTIMQRLNIQGHTIIQVTHSPADAAYSKRILHLVDGNIVREEMVERPTIGSSVEEHQSNPKDLVPKLWRIAQLTPKTSKDDLASIHLLASKSTSREAKLGAASCVVRWADFGVKSIMETLFRSEDWTVRTEFLKNLKNLPAQEAVSYYIEALSDTNSWVRHISMTEIKCRPQSDLSEQNQKIVLEKLTDPDERVRASTIYIVGKWQISGKDTLISRALNDRDDRVRANAVECISDSELRTKFGDELIKICKEDGNNRVRANAAKVIAEINPKLALDTAALMLKESNVMQRASGAWLLGAIGSSEGHRLLVQALQFEAEEFVTNQIIHSLSKAARGQFTLSKQIQTIFSEAQGGLNG